MTPSKRVLEALAEAKGIDVVDLHPPLGDVIDPDALNTLFATTESTTLEVSFQYNGYDVTMESEGTVDVREPDSGSNNPT